MEETIQEQVPEETEQAKEKEQNDPLTACQKELADIKSRFMYLSAEFDNYKKRISKEQATWAEYAQDQALLDLLAVNDDIQRALSELEDQELPEEVRSHFKGLQLIEKTFETTLKKYGIEQIAQTKTFDPALFEAVMQQESDDHTEGEIIAVLQKGYQRNGRVLRPAKVSVAK